MSGPRACCIVETNVALVASGYCEEASADCVANCQAALRNVMSDGFSLALDEAGQILAEYKKKLSPTGEPGVGDRFLKWVYINQYNSERCQRVQVYPADADGLEYAELTSITGIGGFDADDRKFLVTALCAPIAAPVLNAVDSDWLDYREAIEAAGVRIEFLCGEEACVRGS